MGSAALSSAHGVATERTDAPPVANLFAEITAGLADGRQLETLLRQFLGPIVSLAGAQAGLVRILSEDGQHMRLVGDLGLPPEVRLAELSVDRHCGTCGVAADQDALTWAVDLQPCARHTKQGSYFSERCKRMLAVPLRHRERLLGVYNLFFEQEGDLGPDILAVLRSIGELLGLALHNAQLEREHLCATVMSERKFLASEVHDSIAQTLVYVNMRLPLLQDAMLRHDDSLSFRYFSDVEQAVGSIHADLREIMVNFRTPMAPHGLLPALQELSETFRQRSGIRVAIDSNATDLGLSVEQEVQIFHIVQEALANVARHAKARHAWLSLDQQEGRLEVRVRDDGLGPVTASADDGQSHFGLGIMRERAQRLGGEVDIGPHADGGTQVRLTLPLEAALQGAA
jgi:two-component system nitrate/nitrite sensor histidine kinase NarX